MTTGDTTTASGTALSPQVGDPSLDGDHERMSHIVLEGFRPSSGEFVRDRSFGGRRNRQRDAGAGAVRESLGAER